MDISTFYLGLKLKNPIIIASGPLTKDVKGVKRCVDAGAGAVVLKSLFEEQLSHDTSGTREAMTQQAFGNSAAYDYLDADVEMQYASREYLRTIQECKDSVGVPIIASVNCTSAKFWREFSSQIQLAGADALELNIAIFPKDIHKTAAEIENEYVEVVKLAKQTVSIPLAVKVGPFFTHLPNVLHRLSEAGADGFVLFNRFYPPTIDIKTPGMAEGSKHSAEHEISGPLRAVGLCEGRVPGDFAATTGIHTGEDLVRLLLAGASAVQILTTLLKNGKGRLTEMLDFLQAWMEKNRYEFIDEFRGMLAEVRSPEAGFFSRTQYMAMYGRKNP